MTVVAVMVSDGRSISIACEIYCLGLGDTRLWFTQLGSFDGLRREDRLNRSSRR